MMRAIVRSSTAFRLLVVAAAAALVIVGVARLRDTRRFPDAAALVAQLREDEAAARRALTRVEESGNLYSSAIYDLS